MKYAFTVTGASTRSVSAVATKPTPPPGILKVLICSWWVVDELLVVWVEEVKLRLWAHTWSPIRWRTDKAPTWVRRANKKWRRVRWETKEPEAIRGTWGIWSCGIPSRSASASLFHFLPLTKVITEPATWPGADRASLVCGVGSRASFERKTFW